MFLSILQEFMEQNLLLTKMIDIYKNLSFNINPSQEVAIADDKPITILEALQKLLNTEFFIISTEESNLLVALSTAISRSGYDIIRLSENAEKLDYKNDHSKDLLIVINSRKNLEEIKVFKTLATNITAIDKIKYTFLCIQDLVGIFTIKDEKLFKFRDLSTAKMFDKYYKFKYKKNPEFSITTFCKCFKYGSFSGAVVFYGNREKLGISSKQINNLVENN